MNPTKEAEGWAVESSGHTGSVDRESLKWMIAHRAALLDAMRERLGQRRVMHPTRAPGPNRRADR